MCSTSGRPRWQLPCPHRPMRLRTCSSTPAASLRLCSTCRAPGPLPTAPPPCPWALQPRWARPSRQQQQQQSGSPRLQPHRPCPRQAPPSECALGWHPCHAGHLGHTWSAVFSCSLNLKDSAWSRAVSALEPSLPPPALPVNVSWAAARESKLCLDVDDCCPAPPLQDGSSSQWKCSSTCGGHCSIGCQGASPLAAGIRCSSSCCGPGVCSG